MHASALRFALALALAGGIAGAARDACAQDAPSGWNPRTGDAWVDAQLADINRYGQRYRDPFIDEMARYHDAPRDLVGALLRGGWAPGDIYFACALAQLVGRPCRDVVAAWERDHAQGWGAIAQGLGIRPGSPEFHRLKRGLVPTFDRWGRPIQPDASLAPDFPGRVAPRGGPGHAHERPPAAGHGDAGHGQGKGRDHGHGGGKGHG